MNMSVPEVLARYVFPVLGIDDFHWDICRDGHCQGGTGLHISCEDVAKLGLLYLGKGVYNGQRVLSEEWVEMATSKQTESKGGTPDWQAGYGFQFWRNAQEGFRADGAFGQLCLVLPEREIVISVITETEETKDEFDAIR